MAKLSITMPRGDIRNVRFQVKDGETVYTDFTEVYFTVKKKSVNTRTLIQKRLSVGSITLDVTTGYFSFKIEPEDTNELEYGDYVFDIEVVKGDIIKQTTVGILTLTEEVTFEGDE